MRGKAQFRYGEDRLSIGLALDLAAGRIDGLLGEGALRQIARSKAAVDAMVEQGIMVYGINTGFGPLCTTLIPPSDIRKLQINLLQSHSVGVGEPIPAGIARLMLILKLQALAMGYSGIAPATAERILWHIRENVIPIVPSQGSVGASGDLAPLSHLFLPLIGLGKVTVSGRRYDTGTILQRHGLAPLELGPKEGLALINGTQFISAFAIEVAARLQNCLDHADIVAAMNLEAMLGSAQPFLPELHDLRPYAGCRYVAQRMRLMLAGSEILKSHEHCARVQDQYSLRCIPQVHGASRNAWLHLKEMLSVELNSVTDNPIIFNEHKAVSGGHFHGQPLALPLDYAAMAAAELGNIADRRIYFSLEGRIEGLPKLLMEDTGLNSGFMIPQYTSAALVSENKALCFPASVDSIPTSLGQEDHVSMGPVSARKALMVVENLEKILAIELVCAAQGFDFRKPLKSTPLLNACHDHVRQKIDPVQKDRVFADDINTAIGIIRQKQLVKVVNETAAAGHIDLQNERHELFGIY
jgi:histidine ammonia-lyase